ncbi:MAG: thiazole synthase, partial [Deferribacterales bacterium]|nr:thiazole synthase [Deferribacterales bacterium]
MSKDLIIAGRHFKSRLMIGTGKFSSAKIMQEAVKAAQSEIVTVALRRVDIDNPDDDI